VRYLIDGYNLLHATGIVGGPADGDTLLAQSRGALVRFLAEAQEALALGSMTVVFDAAGAPPGLPKENEHRGVKIRFAREYATADALIEDLIARHSTPRRLTVVSSDHRIQRAARRRKATAIDSDAWFHDLLRQKRHPTGAAAAPPPNSSPKAAHGEAARQKPDSWLTAFAEIDVDAIMQEVANERTRPGVPPSPPETASPVEEPHDPTVGAMMAAADAMLESETREPFDFAMFNRRLIEELSRDLPADLREKLR